MACREDSPLASRNTDSSSPETDRRPYALRKPIQRLIDRLQTRILMLGQL
jgi:hypothetical protein